jgi:hypothetical protein
MKNLLTILIFLIAPLVWAADRSTAPAPASTAVTGEILEVQEVESYTYLRLKTRDGETWAAVTRTPVRKGATVTIENAMVINNFESKALKKTFQTIVFGTLAGANPQGSEATMVMPHGGMTKAVETKDEKVAKASGPNAKTVAEIITQAASLKDKAVLVRGKVVKYNAGIMGKNWIHLRDGSGSAAASTNDVLITSMNAVKVGDIVTAKGIVRTDKDFGSGYVYKVIVEEANFQEK